MVAYEFLVGKGRAKLEPTHTQRDNQDWMDYDDLEETQDYDDIDADAMEAMREAEEDEVREQRDRQQNIFTTKYDVVSTNPPKPFAPIACPDNDFSSSPPAFSSPLTAQSKEKQKVAMPSNWQQSLPKWMNAGVELDDEVNESSDEDKENESTQVDPDTAAANARKRLEEALEMEMFGSGVRRLIPTDPQDFPEKPPVDMDDDDLSALFSDSDVDDEALKPWEAKDKEVLPANKRKALVEGFKNKAAKAEENDEPAVKSRYKQISLSDSEDDSSDEEVSQRPGGSGISKVSKTGFYGDVQITDEDMGFGRPYRPAPAPRPKSPVIEYDEDGEPMFQYPDSSDDEQPAARPALPLRDMDDNNHTSPPPNQQRQRHQSHENDDPSAPRLFSTDPHNPPPHKKFSLPTGGRKKAPSKAEIEAKRYKELMRIAQQMKKEIEARNAGVVEQRPGENGEYDEDEWNRRRTGSDVNYLLMPTDGRSWRTGVDSKGRRLYFPLRGKADLMRLVERASGTRKVDLLGESIHVLLRKLEEEVAREADEKEARRQVYERMGSQEGREMLGEESVEIGEKQDGKLWVDKYAPRMYVDLLGEERINREVLTWVKQWDHCVFKKPIKKIQPGGNVGSKEWINKPVDPYHRPEKKILLLSGPAGLGKTTLAHIVGRHSGYNVIEINASDDRTGESLRNKLIGAIESQSLNSKRPNLIIIDEIDGASASGGEESFMKLLVDLANGELKVKGTSSSGEVENEGEKENDEPSDKNAKPTSSKRRVLLRPIICICNDQYAPVLRPLRAIAQTYAFRPPPHRILANRLTEICKQEGLQTDLRVLMTLCELTDGDIRSSLNTLQFFGRKTRVLTIEMLAGMEVGSKDMTRGLFRVWEDVFTIPSAKKKKKLGGGEDGDAGRYIHRLLALVSANGEVDKILQGCYENYLKMRVVDTVASTSDTTRSATKIEQALDWLVFHDRIDKFLIVDKDFELFKYQPFTIVNFYRLFAGISKPTIEFPRADYDNFVTRRMNENIVSMFINTLSLSERVTWGNRARVLQELVTPLLQIISPDFRAVNVNLLKSNERIVLDRLVDVMVSFGLKFVQEKGEDGHYMFKLFPPVEKLAIGKTDTDARHIQSITYPVKQLISNQIETESIRRSVAASNERMKKMGANGTGNLFSKRGSSSSSQTPKKVEPPTPSQVVAVPAATVKPLIAKDFFGRPIVVVDEDEDLSAPVADGATVTNERSYPQIKLVKLMVQLLDGGLSTHLETLGATFGDDPLWSARLLLSEEGRQLIQKAHEDYIEAGCDILTTASYQAFVPTANVPQNVVLDVDYLSLFPTSVQVARAAILKSGKSSVKVAASMGSYGAVLANGAEFTGDFGSLTRDALVEFHRIRIEAVAATKPDLLAFETVPSVFESSAIVKALEQCSSKGITLQPAWISFSCRDSHSSNAGDSAEACATSIKDSPFVFGVGVNCTKPEFVKGILESYKKTLEGTGKVLMCYPNKGETWDAVGRGWVDQTGVQNVEAYADMAKSWIEAGATIVGGCCRIGPNHLACLKASL